jgi:CheY-like chemotaxis protein
VEGVMVNAPGRNPQILIVEDNQTVQFLIEVVLANEGQWQPTSVDDGETAIKLWENGHFDLILMDMLLPGIDGIETTKIIRAIEKENGRTHTPIIFLTSVEENNFCQECIDAGADDFITKPVDMEIVIDKIYKHLHGLLH